MAHIIEDRVLETSTTTGTGSIALAGAVTGYRTFSSVMANADSCMYMIEAVDGSGVPTGEWETGYGEYASAGNTLARTSVNDSSNSGSLVNFAAGTKRVALALIGRLKGQPRILGSNGSFSLNEFSLSQFLDTLGATQGSVIYRDAASWTGLAAGLNGQVLRSGGSGANPSWGSEWTSLKLAADYNNATTTLANITDGTTALSFTPDANTDWELEARLLVWTTATANLPRVGVAVAAGATRGYGGVNIWQAGATATTSVSANGAWSDGSGITVVQIAAGGVLTASVPYVAEVIMAGRSGASPTTISMQMACETAAASTCYIKRGSFMKYRNVI